MLNVAIIGLGRWGQTLVASVQEKSDLLRFTTGATGSRAKAEAFAAGAGITLKDSYEEVLADPAVEAVVLATPHLQHAAQIEAAARAGKHVFVEKPFTMSKASAEAAVAASEAAGITLALGHNRRFHPHMQRLRALVRGGELGTILHCHAELSSPTGLFLPKGVWRTDPEQSPAGGMTGLGIHLVDSMIDLFGAIEAVACQSVNRVAPSGAEDTTSVMLRFASGQTGTLLAFTATAPVFRFSAYGAKGVASITTPTLGGFSLEPAPTAPGQPAPAATHETLAGFDTLHAELEAFARAVRGQAPYPIPPADMIHGVAVLEAIVAAVGRDRFVPVA
ncbi:Gfo/Idh/MocA family oxidoreductase [Ancylobacter sp. Lp-2]|uniref:Gfo/Idh/MocA family protein n=1 Tax=Ancylobacter sp. Lp-2 TaxID=2881339 RepID=UPI001E3AB9AF|nr:Gfo/Idh/MocA family oxidoreductase [Ancylobacter sp. Lp-2]MCB4768753.1 Gfo/Idh/MocA family oxidoreductase [Ancylobacter sp. Lp-2]